VYHQGRCVKAEPQGEVISREVVSGSDYKESDLKGNDHRGRYVKGSDRRVGVNRGVIQGYVQLYILCSAGWPLLESAIAANAGQCREG
jgi:hypothetical protein